MEKASARVAELRSNSKQFLHPIVSKGATQVAGSLGKAKHLAAVHAADGRAWPLLAKRGRRLEREEDSANTCTGAPVASLWAMFQRRLISTFPPEDLR
jgi:hypothetical protein